MRHQPGSAGPSAKGTSSAPLATSVAPVSSSSPTASMPQAARLPGRRRARRPRGLRRLAAHDRRYDEPTAEGLRAAGPRDRFPGRSVRRWLHPAHRDRGPQGPRECRAESPGATRGRVGLPERGPAADGRSRVGSAPQEKPRPDVSVRAPDTRSTSSGPPSISRPRAAGPRGRQHSRARGMRDGWRRMPGASAGSRAIRRARRHGPATALRPGTTATSDGTSPPRSTRRG